VDGTSRQMQRLAAAALFLLFSSTIVVGKVRYA
jgi:hypothetical protein